MHNPKKNILINFAILLFIQFARLHKHKQTLAISKSPFTIQYCSLHYRVRNVTTQKANRETKYLLRPKLKWHMHQTSIHSVTRLVNWLYTKTVAFSFQIDLLTTKHQQPQQ